MMVQFDVKNVSSGSESFLISFDFVKTPITQIADYIIISASEKNTSDIHFDPHEDCLMVRFRVDGDLQDYTSVPKAYEKNLITRLKLLANMNITETRLPQDGAIKGKFGNKDLDMRVSCLPVSFGEKMVIRILDYTRSLNGLDTLGFNDKNLVKLKRMMGVPNGIILVTGATGSGKSTTTYSILQALNKPETNIITVEDPIEMNIKGINQVQVNSEIGMTFAAALRSILRQDPNVILIGEIRDSETAQIAVRASITGHLVLSTIHTNNSLSTIERLLDMDVERYLLSTALTGIISQRLAKSLCVHCRFQRETTPYEKKIFKRFMGVDLKSVWAANPEGCENCRKGYRGRIPLHEVLELDDEIRTILSNEKTEKQEIAKKVYTNKTITMLQDALGKVLEGLTSFDEVYRVIEIESEDSYTEDEQGEDENNEKEQAPEPVTQPNDITGLIPQINTSTSQNENSDSAAVATPIPMINANTSQEKQSVEQNDNDSAHNDALTDVLQAVSLNEQVQLPNLIDTPGNKSIEETTQTDTLEMSNNPQVSILDLVNSDTNSQEIATQPMAIDNSVNSLFSELQQLNKANQEQETTPPSEPEPQPIVEQLATTEEPITQPVLTEPQPVEVMTQEEIDLNNVTTQPTEVLTLEKLDTSVEENNNLITLSTDIQIKGPAEINAEPLVPQI